MSPTLVTIIALGFLVLIASILILFGLSNTLFGQDDLSDRMEHFALIPATNVQNDRDPRRVLFKPVIDRFQGMACWRCAQQLFCAVQQASDGDRLVGLALDVFLVGIGALLYPHGHGYISGMPNPGAPSSDVTASG